MAACTRSQTGGVWQQVDATNVCMCVCVRARACVCPTASAGRNAGKGLGLGVGGKRKQMMMMILSVGALGRDSRLCQRTWEDLQPLVSSPRPGWRRNLLAGVHRIHVRGQLDAHQGCHGHRGKHGSLVDSLPCAVIHNHDSSTRLTTASADRWVFWPQRRDCEVCSVGRGRGSVARRTKWHRQRPRGEFARRDKRKR